MDSAAWDDRYAASELVWSAGPNQFLPPLVDVLAVGSALDLACGEGRNAIWLAQQGWDVTGVDFSAVGIEKARQLAGDSTVNWIVGDATRFDADEGFDLVMIFYLHLDHESFESAVVAAVKAVAEGGTLFGVGHAVRNATEGVGGPPYPEILWSIDEIGPMLHGLEIVELGERMRPVEGSDNEAIDLVFHAERR
ncbi:MAG: methyltransferase domain-containing protein [Actinomycetota bacterium]|nr:methyltransferase domain-containing protein [Actinomycetota bacterium]